MAKYLIFGMLGLAIGVAGLKEYLESGTKSRTNDIAQADSNGKLSQAGETPATPANGTPQPAYAPEVRLKPNGMFVPPALLKAQNEGSRSSDPPSLPATSPTQGSLVDAPEIRTAPPIEITPRLDTSRSAAKVETPDPSPTLATDPLHANATGTSETVAKTPAQLELERAIQANDPGPDPRLKPLFDKDVAPASGKMTVGRQQVPGSPYDMPLTQQQGGSNPIPLYPPNMQQNDPIAVQGGWERDRNPAQVKADSQISDTLLRDSQLAFQNPNLNERQKIPGKVMALEDLFYLTQDRERRFQLIRAYWKLALAMAEYHWALDEYIMILPLERIGGGAQTIAHRYIEAVMYSSQARISDTKTAAINAQYELLVLMGNSARTAPLAVDVPLVGTYNTQFSQNFPDNRAAPQRLRAIDKTVDLQRDSINTRAIAIQRTYAALVSAKKLYETQPTEIQAQGFALAFEQLTRHRRAFLNSVREYNIDIAEYAMMTLPGNYRPAEIAKLLNRRPSPALWNSQAAIETEADERSVGRPAMETRVDRDVTQATFNEPVEGERWSRPPEMKSVMKRND
ncbi:MAG: hypothetical protein QM811_09355 [Pirellulales bacterium]